MHWTCTHACAAKIKGLHVTSGTMTSTFALVKDNQTGFVKGRRSTERFLYAQQVIHLARENKVPIALFKADIKHLIH